MKEIRHSCVDCGTTNCSSMNSTFPPFCVSQTIPEEVMDSVMTEYQDPENRQIMIVASEVEDTGYCVWPRVQEIVEFAKRMGYKSIYAFSRAFKQYFGFCPSEVGKKK